MEDYRAGLGIDRAHEEADRAASRRIACPTLLAATEDDIRRWRGAGLQDRQLPALDALVRSAALGRNGGPRLGDLARFRMIAGGWGGG
jgi:hypothetical protein